VGRIVVMNHVTLDAVMQGPGRHDEDTRGGFTQGGWGQRSTEPGDAAGPAMGERMAAGGGLTGWLFSKWTYEHLLSYWNRQPDSPFTPALNDTPKYVVSTSMVRELLTTRLRIDVSSEPGSSVRTDSPERIRTNGVAPTAPEGRRRREAAW
jgi:hypothetical protein